jgi:sec-independent protein translocase protein TatA
MPNIQGGELLVILLIVLLVFGGTKIPQLARSLGQAQREFRKGSAEGVDVDEKKDTKPST